MNKEEKAAVVDQIAEQLQDAEAIFAVDYRGISVPDAAELRNRLREADATFRVVKNRLTIRAAEKAGADGLQGLLEGPTALTFVRGDAAVAAKALNDFARARDMLEFKGGTLGDQTLSVDEIRSIARLPARDVLHGHLVGMVASPLTGLVGGLNALIAGIAIQLRQIHDQGLVTGEAPAPEEAAPAEAAPSDEAPSEEAPSEEAPSEEAPSEEASAEEVPAEEVPAEEASTQEAPAEEAPAVEEAPAGEQEPAAAPEGEQETTDNEEADASAAADEDAAEA